jgi:hypothetical protein
MNIIRRIWTGIVAAIAGIALAILVQIVGQMAFGMPIDYLKWIIIGFASFGFLIGAAFGPRKIKA